MQLGGVGAGTAVDSAANASTTVTIVWEGQEVRTEWIEAIVLTTEVERITFKFVFPSSVARVAGDIREYESFSRFGNGLGEM